ncbi:MAG: hypothetical protein QE487_01955 [Fluviicola sp.]|nr:hypothetical protein [Fluviicola sp.]
MNRFLYILLLAIASQPSIAQKSKHVIALTRESWTPIWRSEIVEKSQIMIIPDSIPTIIYRKNPRRKWKTFKEPIDVSYFTDSLNYSVIDSIVTNSLELQGEKKSCYCEFRNKGSLKVSLKDGDAMVGKTVSWEMGTVIDCEDRYYFDFLKKLEDEYRKLFRSVF